ncbi:uroporphyrin-III C-methyltransferase [Xylanimonas cellulosilytica DSM 15894]|uniref:uroporphyrinogen-III C-methyltransferase n=1 Tax=Xylanimonas cellulosilytica (strain DSM 15894 / JCM 12276 / CECT 5975 / KCTC 9989 / LMG 20990 / NBRC 107835 / XIL07) TaxID=446471 RepID=D1BSF8_XYLCX|nr:uroporphyrinogen-III C-methyltransferase [Xylanimonas cellulosilytica]ACZ30650.1 uroporphyrin-III C-methyltransferase [Xylanimonas cellulosilytica DSM 15894]
MTEAFESDAVLEPGAVALVGGGPGALDLVTVRGLALLRQADVVVVDRLGPTGLVSFLGPDVEVVQVGKEPGKHSMRQRDIEALLVEHARAGKRVVRLKGGDPFLLGRGGEEVLACRAAGIPVQVVPGVTSAIAGPGAVEIPVTHRGAAVATHIVNAHGDLGPADIAALRDPQTTTVMLMGVEWLPRLATQALLDGVDPDTPVAVVQDATQPGQKAVFATLGTVVEAAAGIGFPAVIVAGPTAVEGFLVPPHTSPELHGSGREARPDEVAGLAASVEGDAEPDVQPPAAPWQAGAPAVPALVGCAHGTRNRAGRDVIRAILARVQEVLPGVPVREAYVDVQDPTPADVVRELTATDGETRTRDEAPGAVVVPLLLSAGFHVSSDIGAAVAGTTAVATDPLGPDPRLAEVLADRLAEAGVGDDDAVVLAVAGTRDEQGQAQARVMADLLAARLGREVPVGFVAAARPSVAAAVSAARGTDQGRRVAVASYLLAPGYFHGLLDESGADVVAAPLGDHPLVADVVRDRYLAAAGD